MLGQTIFQTILELTGALACAGCAVFYFQRRRLERPAVGVFNPRDIAILFLFILTLPALYLILPNVMLTGFLVITFTSALYIALRPLLPTRYLWLVIPSLLIADIVVTEALLGTRMGWQVYWIINSTVVLLAAVGVSNLYVQGGMSLRHIAWFTILLAVYDLIFSVVIPLSPMLADRFQGQPLDPSIGFSLGTYSANIGLGDLLVYSLFITAAYKGFGKKGLIASFVIIPIFGALLPGVAPLVFTAFVRSSTAIVVPAQAFFGPAAFVTYLWLSRHAPERNMAQWFKVQAAAEPGDRKGVVSLATTRVATTSLVQRLPDM